jgi:hypothetical protein
MSQLKRRLKIANFIALATCVVLGYQACGGKINFQSTQQKAAMNSGNGGSYGGKPGTWVKHDPSNSCEVATDGNALPNEQINIDASKAELVRSNCQDLTPPQLLSAADIQTSANGITYQGKEFLYQAPPAEFQIVAASCPASLKPIAGASRVNLLNSSQTLLAPDWTIMAGVTSMLEGTIAGLDGFRITRTNLTSYERIKQQAPLVAGNLYALSVLARHGSDNSVRLEYEAQANGISTVLNTSTGSVTISNNVNFSQVSFTSHAISDARFFTVYFSPNVDMPIGDVGVTTSQVAVGESIFATAVQLEDVSSFCAP